MDDRYTLKKRYEVGAPKQYVINDEGNSVEVDPSLPLTRPPSRGLKVAEAAEAQAAAPITSAASPPKETKEKKKPLLSIEVGKPDIAYGMKEDPYDAMRDKPFRRPYLSIGVPPVKVTGRGLPANGTPPGETPFDGRDEGARPEPGKPNKDTAADYLDEAARRPPGMPNLPEERVPSQLGPFKDEGYEEASVAVAAHRAPVGLPAEPDLKSNVDLAKTVNYPRNDERGIQVPDNVAGQQESAVSKWWSSMPPEQKTAIQRALLTSGLSLMAQAQPSRYPISPVAQFGQAGLEGVSAYDRSLSQSERAGHHRSEINLRERELATHEQRLRLEVDKAMRTAEMESPGTTERIEQTQTPTSLRLNTQGIPSGPIATRGDGPGPRRLGLNVSEPPAAQVATRPERGIVTTPGKPAGIEFQKKKAEIAKIEAETDRAKAETKKALTVAETGPRDHIKEKALDAANRAAGKILEIYQGDPEVSQRASEVADGVYQTSVHLQMGHRFIPGTPGKPGASHWFSPDEPDQPPVPGYWVDANGNPVNGGGGDQTGGLPPGSVQIGTSGGKPVYQSPDGRKFIVE